MLSVILIILGLDIEFINIGELINTPDYLNLFNIIIYISIFFLYITIIVLSIIIIIRYIMIMKGKKYRTINPEMYIDEGENKKKS